MIIPLTKDQIDKLRFKLLNNVEELFPGAEVNVWPVENSVMAPEKDFGRLIFYVKFPK